ncbi:MAG: ABC-2 transporter permease [Bacillota bacterium]|nr:ABC-2 transporter permease [Bacillota bacterium]
MNNVFKSIKLDNYILKTYFRTFIVFYVIATIAGILLAKTPAVIVPIVMIVTAPFIGTYFSVYEKNSLDKLYGVLPLGKFEVVTGRYLYSLLLGMINGIIGGILACIISLITGKGLSFPDYLNYLSVAFLCFSIFIGILLPIYFKFPFSKVYVFANLPIYLCGVVILYLVKKTDILKNLGSTIQYFTDHQYMIWLSGFGLGLLLLFISFLISYAISRK